MPAKCFGCGADGYIQSECPFCAADIDSGKPPWCGICDRQTRHVWLNADGTAVQRCPRCHPRRSKTLAQHRRCGECRMTVYTWDNEPCGNHQAPGMPDRRLPINRIREIERSNS